MPRNEDADVLRKAVLLNKKVNPKTPNRLGVLGLNKFYGIASIPVGHEGNDLKNRTC